MNAPTRRLVRADGVHIVLSHLPAVDGVDCRLFRRSPGSEQEPGEFLPTEAGLVIPVTHLPELIAMLTAMRREVEA